MKVLVTGANGFLGSHLVAAFAAAGHEVFALEHSSSKLERLADLSKDKIALSDQIHLEDYFARHAFDGIVHTVVHYGRGSGSQYLAMLDVNVKFPMKILSAAAGKLKFFINCHTILTPEASPYALSKEQFSQWAKILCQESGIDFWNLKMDQFFGPGEAAIQFPSKIVKACLSNEKIELSGGEQLRDFTYVDDIVRGFVRVLEYIEQNPKPSYHNVGVGTGSPQKLKAFVETIKKHTGSSSNLVFGRYPYRKGELELRGPDISFLKGLGWSAKTDVDTGVKNLIASLSGGQH